MAKTKAVLIKVPDSLYETVEAIGGLVEAMVKLEWTKAAYIKAIYTDLYDGSVPSPVRTAEQAVAEVLKGFNGFSARNIARYRQRFDKTFPDLKDSFGFGDELDVTGLEWETIHQPATDAQQLKQSLDNVADKSIDEAAKAVAARADVLAKANELAQEASEAKEVVSLPITAEEAEKAIRAAAEKLHNIRLRCNASFELKNGEGMTEEQYKSLSWVTNEIGYSTPLWDLFVGAENLRREFAQEDAIDINSGVDTAKFMEAMLGEGAAKMDKAQEQVESGKADWDEGLAAMQSGEIDPAPQGVEDQILPNLDFLDDEDEDED